MLSVDITLGSISLPSVSILGTAQVGSTLSLSGLPAVGDGPNLVYGPQWYRDGVPIDGEDGASFYVAPENAGFTITASVLLPNGTTVWAANSVAIPLGAISATWAPARAAVSAAYLSAPDIAGGSGTYAVVLTSGYALPPGLALDSETGEISGSPTAAGSYAISLTITDTNGEIAVVAATVVVAAVPVALGAGDYTVSAAQGQPHKAIFEFITAIPADVAGARYQAIAGGASTGWTGNYSLTGSVVPVINTPYVSVRDVPTALIGKQVNVRPAFVADLGQTNISFAAAAVKTVDLAPLVSGVADVGGTLSGTVTWTTTGASGTCYLAPMSSVDTDLTPEEQARAVKAASIALGASWQKTISAAGAQTHTISGLPAGTSFAPVHVVHEIAGVIGNWSAGDGFATAGAPAPALTVTEPTGDPEVLDGGSMASFLADADTIVTAAYAAAGTAPGAAVGSSVTLSLIATLAATPALLAGLSGNPTLTQILDAIEANAVTWFNAWTATDPRTAAQWAADTPNTTRTDAYRITVSGAPAPGQPKILVVSGMDFGDAGLIVDGGWVVIVVNCRLAGTSAINGSSVISFGQQVVGRGDGTEHWTPGWPNDACVADGSSDFLARGIIVTGHAGDAFKQRRETGGSLRKGRFHVSGFYVNASCQYPAAPQPYSPTRAYLAGEVFYPPGVTRGPQYWRVLQPFTDYLATTGASALPTFSSAGSNAWLMYQDIHGDGVQNLATNENFLLEGGVFALGAASHLLAAKLPASAPKGNAVLYNSTPDDRGVTGPCVYRGIRIKDPEGSYKGLQSLGTSNVGGVPRPPAQAVIHDIQMHDGTQPWDLDGDSIVTYARITDAAGAAIAPPSPAVEDTTLPAVTLASLVAPVQTPVSLPAGSATVTAGAWAATVNIPYTGSMLWAIRATLGSLSAVTSRLIRTDLAAAAPTWAVTANAFAYDKAIFDSGAAFGGTSATIPLSGTTDAPNGEIIEARAVLYDHLTDTPTGVVTAWADAATVTGGAWFGSRSLPLSVGTYARMQVRVKGSSAAAATIPQRVAAGHKWALYEQSNWDQVIFDTETLAAAAVVDPEALQLFWVTRPKTAGVSPVATRSFITTATPFSPGVAAIANVLAAERPGEKFALVAHVLSGSTPQEMVRNPGSVTYPLPTSDSGRNWGQELALHTLATACGQQVGVVWNMGWVAWLQTAANAAQMLPFMTGRERNGTVVPLGGTTAAGDVLTHCLTELYSFWNGTTGYTRMSFCGPHGQGWSTNKPSVLVATDIQFEALIEEWRSAMLDTATFPQMLYCRATNDGALRGEDDGAGGWTDVIHHHGNVDWGRNRLARLGAMHMLETAGMVSWQTPAFTNCSWAADGSYVDWWIAGRHITTERNRMGGTSPYVRGWSLNGAHITTAQIQPNAGGSGWTGIRVTPPSGAFDYRTLAEFGRGELPGFVAFPADYRTDYVLDLPVVDVGASGMPALPILMRSTAGFANPLPAPASFTVASPAGPAFKDGNGYGSTGLLTFRAKMKWLNGTGAANLLTLSGTNVVFERLSTGLLRLAVKDSAANVLLGSTTLNASAPDNVVRDIVLSINLGALTAKVWIDGALTDDRALTAPTSPTNVFGSSRQLLPLGNGALTPGGSPNAVVEFLEIHKAATTTGDTSALGAPYKRIEGGAGGTIVQSGTAADTDWIV